MGFKLVNVKPVDCRFTILELVLGLNNLMGYPQRKRL